MLYICNSFSLSMLGMWRLNDTCPTEVRVTPVADPKTFIAKYFGDVCSVVGHADTARIFEKILQCPVPVNRTSIVLAEGGDDIALVGQYEGARLPEGATALPSGASISWVAITIHDKES